MRAQANRTHHRHRHDSNSKKTENEKNLNKTLMYRMYMKKCLNGALTLWQLFYCFTVFSLYSLSWFTVSHFVAEVSKWKKATNSKKRAVENFIFFVLVLLLFSAVSSEIQLVNATLICVRYEIYTMHLPKNGRCKKLLDQVRIMCVCCFFLSFLHFYFFCHSIRQI